MTDSKDQEDDTVLIKIAMIEEINAMSKDREQLEKLHGKVYDTRELAQDFEVLQFGAPMVYVQEKKTKKMGTLLFQHNPRFYFSFQEDNHAG